MRVVAANLHPGGVDDSVVATARARAGGLALDLHRNAMDVRELVELDLVARGRTVRAGVARSDDEINVHSIVADLVKNVVVHESLVNAVDRDSLRAPRSVVCRNVHVASTGRRSLVARLPGFRSRGCRRIGRPALAPDVQKLIVAN